MPTAVKTVTIPSTDGVSLALHDLGGEGPPLLFCHPTGFHGLVWLPVAAELTDRVHAWAIDFRGHGDSTIPESGSLAWAGMGDDVLAAIDVLNRANGSEADSSHGTGAGGGILAAGFSMGGAALMLAEQAQPGTLRAAWCYEPIVFPSGGPAAGTGNPLAAAARRRKAVFPDRESALHNYASKPPMGTLHPDALSAYVEHGFRDLSEGGVTLKCAPETEAAVFEGSLGSGAYEHLADVRCPVTVAMSGDGGFPAQMAPRLVEQLPDGRLERFADLTHFGPLEEPRRIAAAIRAALLVSR